MDTLIEWGIALLMALLTPAEWGTFLLGLLLTFAITYVLKLGYNLTPLREHRQRKHHLRALAVVAGVIAAYLVWQGRMPWYVAGVLLGAASAGTHFLLSAFSKSAVAKRFAPWLYAALRGYDRRKARR